jgi:hypothetical protein
VAAMVKITFVQVENEAVIQVFPLSLSFSCIQTTHVQHEGKHCWGELKEAILGLDLLPLESDLLKTLHLVRKKNKHQPLTIY